MTRHGHDVGGGWDTVYDIDERDAEEAAALEREVADTDKWKFIYAAAESDGDHPWWLSNDNGWCTKCHKHRYNAGAFDGCCFACGTDLNEVTLVHGGGYGSTRRDWWKKQDDVYCLNPECHVTTFWPNEFDKKRALRNDGVVPCWSCKENTVREDDLFGKEVRLVSAKSPDIYVERDAHAYAMAVVQECPGEVGGLGYVEKLENGDLRIYEFAVIEQEATASGVEFNDDAMHEFLTKNADRPDAENLRLSWHSHGNMSCYFSGTDTGDAITKYKKSGIPWLLSLIFNRKGELATRLDVFDSEVREQIYLEDLVYKVERPTAIAEQAKADVKALVHKPPTYSEKKAAEKAAEKKEKEDKAKSSPSKALTVVEGDTNGDGPDLSRKPNKATRKKMRQELYARSDFSMEEVRKMDWQELARCLWYVRQLAKEGNDVIQVGDDLPEELRGKSIHELTDEEWVIWCDAQGYELDPVTRRMLIEQSKEANAL